MFYDIVDMSTWVTYSNLSIDHPHIGDILYLKKKHYIVVVVVKTVDEAYDESSNTKVYIKPSSDEILKIVE